MRTNHVKTPVELVYLNLMLRWEQTAPSENHQALLDGQPARNTQTARLAFILNKVAAGCESRVFPSLCSHTRRADGRSYVSQDSRWMKEPYPLLDGWYLEGCQNIGQKLKVTEALRYLDLSAQFVACVDEFVSGRSVQGFMPTQDECEEMLRDAPDPLEGLPPEIRDHAEKLITDLMTRWLASERAASRTH